MAARAAKGASTAAAAPASDEVELVVADPVDEGGEDDALAELRGLGAGGDHRYTVSRVSTEPGRKAGYCKTYTVGDLSLDTIREEFGGGKFKIRVIDSAGKYVTQTTVDIVDLPKQAAPAAPVVPQGADLAGIAQILAATNKGGDGGLAQVMAMMMKQQESTTQMIVALMNRPQPTGPTLTELLTLIRADKNDNKTDPVALLLQGLELGKTLAGGGGETGMLDVAKEGLAMLTPLIQRETAAPAAPRPAAPLARLPAPAGAAKAPAPATTAQPVETAAAAEGGPVDILKQVQWIKAQLNILVHHASRDKDPELYAEVMLDNLPPFITVEDIEKHIGAPDAIANLSKLDPRVAQYQSWFEQFREAVQNFLKDEETGPEQEERDNLDELSDLDNPTGMQE